MRASNDGFEIANKDLELRQAGDLVGTKQSGLPQYRVANLDVHLALLLKARDHAAELLSRHTPEEIIAHYKRLFSLFGYKQLMLKG
jgi:ATP-dependent DNA helicase RecG